MLDKMIARKFTLADCQEYREATKAELALTGIRLSRLLNTQSKNPKWAAYDKYADDIVGIGIRIEEQYAVAEMLEEELTLIDEREDTLKKEAARPPVHIKPKPTQLNLFGERGRALC